MGKIYRIEPLEDFKIICSKCNSENVGKAKEFFDNPFDNAILMNNVIICKDCGHKETL